MNGKFGGSSCLGYPARAESANILTVCGVMCECELPELENQSEEYWKLKRAEKVPARR